MNSAMSHDIVALKRNAHSQSTFTMPINDASAQCIGRLVCVDRAQADDPRLQQDLTDWRRRYMKFFLTQFEPSPARTAAWLQNIVLPGEDRILFLIETDLGMVIGHIGVSNIDATSAELDNLIRGRHGGDARLIYFAELAVLHWIYGTLGKQLASLHVFSTNRITTALHESVGFRVHAQKRLSKTVRNGETAYLVDSTEGEVMAFTYNEMRLSRAAFIQNHGEPTIRATASVAPINTRDIE